MKFIAVITGKLLILLSRLFSFGGGSSYPGLVALRIDPNLIIKITGKLRYGSIIITGTNGKTTSSKYLSSILKNEGYGVIHNRTGSNLMRGVASALIEQSTLFGTPLGDIGLFEIDEATMKDAVKSINPKVVLVTNLFRDQLDRYGELDKTATVIVDSMSALSDSTILLNADDPLVASLSGRINGKNSAVFFGLNDATYTSKSRASMDSNDCLLCGAGLVFDRRYYGHLGIYHCPNCSSKRPDPHYEAKGITLYGIKNSSYLLADQSGSLAVSSNVSGIYNVYNSLAAFSIARSLGIGIDTIGQSLDASEAAFGRMEKLSVDNMEIYLLLVKNPIGLTQIAETLSTDQAAHTFMLVLNDNFADGTDVSWIWDADITPLRLVAHNIFVSGIRAADMALRLKYEDFDTRKITTIGTIEQAFEHACRHTPENETLYVMTTYTGMLQLRNYLTKRGAVGGFWEEEAA
ncbi:MAG: MurT ligase domain-containing protein [Candidatus Aquicultor sp.]